MKRVLKPLLGLAIIGVGVAIFVALVHFKQEPASRPPADPSVAVTVARAAPADEPVTIRAMGITIPARRMTVLPEVGGRAVWVSPDLVPGARVAAGQVLVRIDPRDYDLAIEQQRAAVGRAELNLATERARKAVAEREWALIADEVQPSEEGRPLALREIQTETARVSLRSARSSLDKARLDRGRATIKAPWDALVIDKSVDAGQVVSPGTRIVTLVDSSVFWVQATIPMESLGWIALPDGAGGLGSPATVIQQVGRGRDARRPGRVIRLLGDLDPVGRMARLLVEVRDPLDDGAASGSSAVPLLLDAHVAVDIEGPRVEDAVALPRVALRDGNAVWVEREGALAIERVTVVWSTEDRVFVRGDLAAGENVVVSRIAAPVEGMKLRAAVEGDGADAGPRP